MRRCAACQGGGMAVVGPEGGRWSVRCPCCRGLGKVPETAEERQWLAAIRRGEMTRVQAALARRPELREDLLPPETEDIR